MNKSIKKIIKWVAGPLLAAWLFYSLYQQVKDQPDLGTALALIRMAPVGPDAGKFWLVIVLVMVNWGLESRKWQILMKAIAPVSFLQALRAVLCGVTFSLNTPNRMGEYAGRMLFVKEGQRLRSVTLSIAGSIAQLIITMVTGCFGLAWLVFTRNPALPAMGLSVFWLKIFLYISSLITLGALFFFFRIAAVTASFAKLRYAKKLVAATNVLKTFDTKILLRLLYLSLLRYLVFVFQYIFMLQILRVDQDYWQSFWLTGVMFWVLAVIPSIAIAELGIRGTVAKTIFAFSKNGVGVLAVTFGIWLINLFLPALIGSFLILGIKIKKDNDTKP